jgi:hypothetical protein
MARKVVLTWYNGTNEHRPVAAIEVLLADNVEMFYPNRPSAFVGIQAFREWYAGVLQQFFDETHEVEWWEIKLNGSSASVTVIVRWEARQWTVGLARSSYEAHLSRQHFQIERFPENGRVVITKKIVEIFESTAPIYGVGQ